MREGHFKPFALGRYRCDEQLRAGGIGDLYLAVHLPTGSRRTVWKVCPELLEDPESAEQLLQVQLRVQALTHPNIVAVREILRKESDLFVVMDHHPGISLRQLLLKLHEVGPLAPPVASFVVWQICQALDHTHHLKQSGRPTPLFHGALWPQNVLVSFKGEVRLTEFGTWLVPRAAYEDDDVSIRTHFSYRSPEHVTGGTLTRSTDLFCVGLLLYEMLTARPLFLAKTLMETVQRVERVDLGPMAGVPAPQQQVLRRCMAAEPRDRYADVAAFIAELSLVVVGVGDRAVRQELVRFLAAHFAVRESPPPRPAPLPGQEDDETTSISPNDLTEVLVALSRERTEPGKAAGRPRALVMTPVEEQPPVPTRVEPLAPEPLDVTPPVNELYEGPTTVQDAPDVLPEFDRSAKQSSESAPALFPPLAEEPSVRGPLQAYTTGETTTQASRGAITQSDIITATGSPTMDMAEEEPTNTQRSPEMSEEEPTFTRSPSPEVAAMLPTRPMDQPFIEENLDELPTLNEKPYVDGQPRREPGAEIARQLPPPDLSRAPGPPRWPTGPMKREPTARQGEAARAERPLLPAITGPSPLARPRGAHPVPADLPEQLSSVPSSAVDSGLFFEKARISGIEDASAPAPLPFHPDEGTPLSAFDPDAFSLSYSHSYEAYQKRPRLSPAHIMLGVAVLVFLVAVAMLVRRLVAQPAAVAVAAHDSRPAVSDAALARPDSRRPDAGQGARPTGKAYDDLLKGRLPAGELRVGSTPAQARVYVGRDLRGVTPVVIRVKPRAETDLRVVATGYLMHRQQASLPGDRGLKLDVQLTKSTYPRKPAKWGLLRVRCAGRDLRRVFIDEEDTGFGCVNFKLRPGVHKVGVYSLERDEQINYRLRIRAKKGVWLIVKAKRGR